MSTKTDLETKVKNIFSKAWDIRSGNVVPDDSSVTLGNDAVTLDATVLYADLSDSTNLVDTKKKEFAAEIYKSYLFCAARIIRDEGGEIVAYDGDRIMAVFIGGSKNTSAVKAGLKINWAVRDIINPQIVAQYPNSIYIVKQRVGIDTGQILVAKTGIRNANDLVWVGSAANHAAKLCSLYGCPTYITDSVYSAINDEAKIGGDGKNMWIITKEKTANGRAIYGSTYYWRCD
jgi:class 3 adenylate cyclase